MPHDLRYALRTFGRGGTGVAVAVLVSGLSLGAVTTIFSLVATALLHPLPYDEPQRLVEIRELEPETGELSRVLAGNFADLRRDSRAFTDLAAILSTGMPITSLAEPLNPLMRRASANYLELLRVKPLLGRAFLPEEDRPGGRKVVLLSYGLWQEHLGGDPGVVGKTIELDGEAYEIVGVLPADFRDPLYAGRPALWLPLALSDGEQLRDGGRRPRLTVFGRLAPGRTLDDARAEIRRLGDTLAHRWPEVNAGRTATVLSLYEVVVEGYRPALWALFAAVGLVFAVALTNVANLLLARALTRRPEIAVRRALGAGRRHLVRQLLTESAVLGVAGSALGLALARIGIGPVVALLPEGFGVPRLDDVGIDATVAAFALGLALLTTAVGGLAPLSQAWRGDFEAVLAASAGRSTGGRRGRRARQVLVVAEIALSLALLTGAGLMGRTFWNLSRQSPGFDAAGVFTFRTAARGAEYGDPARWADFYDRVFAGLRALPGVRSVAGTDDFSVTRSWRGTPVHVPGWEAAPGNEPRAMVRTVTPGFFATMGIPLAAGRDFTAADDAGAEPVAIVNREMARRYWADHGALAATLAIDAGERPRRIVGVAGDVRHLETPPEPGPVVYLPHAQRPTPLLSLAVRTSLAEPATLATEVQRAVWQVSRDAPVYNLTTLEELVRDVDWQPRFLLRLLTGFALLAAVLAASGIYAVLSYVAAAERRDIGIRMALGARRTAISRAMLGRALTLLACGLVAGFPLALALGRILRRQLIGVSAADPVTFGAVALGLTAVTLAASWLPARRAARVDPAVALRVE